MVLEPMLIIGKVLIQCNITEDNMTPLGVYRTTRQLSLGNHYTRATLLG